MLIRVDSGFLIGNGHLIRCVNLANALYMNGYEISFLTKEHDGNIISKIPKEFEIFVVKSNLKQKKDNNYASWNCESEDEEAKRVISLIKKNKFDILVVDHYALSCFFEKKIQENTKMKIVSIDDVNRMHSCNLLIDQNYKTTRNDYEKSIVGKFLFGPKFALINSKYSDLCRVDRTFSGVKSILVYFGGTDVTSETAKTLTAIEKLSDTKLVFNIVFSSSNIGFTDISEKCKQLENVQLFEYIEDFASFVSKHDLVFGASGVSNWERLCLGVPSYVVSIADNQIKIANRLHEDKLIKYLGDGRFTTSGDWYKVLIELNSNYCDLVEMAKRGVLISDGEGCRRVVDEINNIVSI